MLEHKLIDRLEDKLVINSDGLDYLEALDKNPASARNIVKESTAPSTNGAPFNWSISFGVVREINPLGREGSYAVRNEFDRTSSEFVRTSSSKGGTNNEHDEHGTDWPLKGDGGTNDIGAGTREPIN